MTRIAILIMLVLVSINTAFIIYAYKLEDEIKDFSLPNVDGRIVSLSDYQSMKGVIVVFLSNECPFSKAYEERIMDLQEKYGSSYPVIAINSNNAQLHPQDNFEEMKKRAVKRKYRFAYLKDDTQQVARIFGASKTPFVYLISRQQDKNVIKYVGAIDDHYEDETLVKRHYLEDAIHQLEKGEEITVKETKGMGCSIKF